MAWPVRVLFPMSAQCESPRAWALLTNSSKDTRPHKDLLLKITGLMSACEQRMKRVIQLVLGEHVPAQSCCVADSEPNGPLILLLTL